MLVVGGSFIINLVEFVDGIELGEEFSYEINVFEGVMYFIFISLGYDMVRFIKFLL